MQKVNKPDLSSLLFETEIVLWENLLPQNCLEGSSPLSIRLDRQLYGNALLRAGEQYLALGELKWVDGALSFRILRLLEEGEGEQLIKEREFSSFQWQSSNF